MPVQCSKDSKFDRMCCHNFEKGTIIERYGCTVQTKNQLKPVMNQNFLCFYEKYILNDSECQADSCCSNCFQCGGKCL